jgi:hypothetical protein
VARTGEGRNVYRVLVGKPEGKRPLERPSRIWEAGIKMDLRENRWRGVGWIHLAQVRDRWRAVVKAVINLRVLAPRSWLLHCRPRTITSRWPRKAGHVVCMRGDRELIQYLDFGCHLNSGYLQYQVRDLRLTTVCWRT